MAAKGADEFLTCVIRRSEKDSIIRIGALILVMVVVPIMAILLTLDAIWVYNNYLADPTEVIEFASFILDHMDDFAGAHMMEYTIGTYILYLVLKTYLSHSDRDITWMDSLIDYAESYGHDTKELRRVRNQSKVEGSRHVTRYFLMWFAIALSLCIFQSLFISLRDMQPHVAVMVINILIFVMIVQMSFTSVYIYRHITYHSQKQHEFTELFSEAMADELPGLGSMHMYEKVIPVWKLMIPLILTLGLFSIISTPMAIHMMNNHIREEWGYEERLVRLMYRQEGAVGVDKVFTEREKTLVEKVYMMFAR